MIGSIIAGLVVGLLARAIKPGADSMGWILTIILGIVGAAVGGFIASAFGIQANGGFGGLVLSVIGAIIVLFIYEFFTKRT
ncbi:GlsB/YeaQ/YmgE family stress response membrane protein [Moraxella haemolytica]|uniref:GlsB/YeaQ/YmgE family stress response membrane protein n=1 Tax=Moraxella TaxID=475 RepID=UPI002543B32F|nr:GlsB/YeaQ/YmgE family stress response membrane protein [Moraxella sp. ZY171148]WII95277.1 GlsB/YeaQ/YmgE family stress response membrane protein [Moraxella sp. ZY171148]